MGDHHLQELNYSHLKKEGPQTFTDVATGWLGITDKYWATAIVPRGGQPFTAHFAHVDTGVGLYQTDFQGAPLSVAPGASAATESLVFRRRQAGVDHRRLPRRSEDRALRSPDRLGHVLVLHQAALLPHRLFLQARRQFRRRHPAGDGAGQGGVLPAGEQVLQVDERHEEGPARDGCDPRALRRRQGEAAAGADGAVQEGEDQSAGRLLAGADPDPGLSSRSTR